MSFEEELRAAAAARRPQYDEYQQRERALEMEMAALTATAIPAAQREMEQMAAETLRTLRRERIEGRTVNEYTSVSSRWGRARKPRQQAHEVWDVRANLFLDESGTLRLAFVGDGIHTMPPATYDWPEPATITRVVPLTAAALPSPSRAVWIPWGLFATADGHPFLQSARTGNEVDNPNVSAVRDLLIGVVRRLPS